MEGKRFGRLTVLSFTGYNNSKRRTFKCLCDCGKECIKDVSVLRRYEDISCGCGKSEKLRNLYLKHGHATYIKGVGRTPTYQSWVGMRFRCRNKDDPHYGGRGISVCAQWDSFAVFLADMGERPEGCEIDRIKVDGNYEPGNCRWVSHSTNSQNTRRTKLSLEKAEAIRARKGESATAIAAEFNTYPAMVRRLWKGEGWVV